MTSVDISYRTGCRGVHGQRSKENENRMQNTKEIARRKKGGSKTYLYESRLLTPQNWLTSPKKCSAQTTIHADRDTFSHSSALKDWENVSRSRFRPRYGNDFLGRLTIALSMHFDVIDHVKLLAFFEVVRGGSWFAKKGRFT